jgi:hypothetical protein
MQRALRWVILASGLGAMAAPNARAAPTRPPAVVESESLAARAFEAYQRHDNLAALELYRQALAHAPSPDITYNIARVCDLGLQDRACAREFYARYIQDPGAARARVSLAQRRLIELAEVERGPGVTDAAERAPGEAARASGEAALPASEKTQPAAPAPRSAPSPPSRREVTREPEAAPSASALDVAAVVAGSVGLVGLSVGVGFGLAARADLEVSERYCDYDRCTSPRGVDAARSASRAANVATAGFVAGGALLGLSAVLWLLDAPREEPTPPGELAIEPGLSLDQVSLTLTGSFGR